MIFALSGCAPMSVSTNPVGYFEIPVTDINRAKAFYSALLGVDFEDIEIHGNKMALFPFDKNKKHISGALAQGEIYKPSLTGSLIYFSVDDIDDVLKKATFLKAEILFPKTVADNWGYVAEIKDSEGNRIALHQSF